MALKVAFPAPTGVGISSADSRSDLRGLLVQNAAGLPRAGVLAAPASFVTSRATMGVNVAGFEAALVRNGLPSFITNDGTVVVPIGASPGANFRYDVVYVKQNESESPFSDANNSPIFGFVSGVASATPDLAAAVALVPAGGLPLAAVLIPSTATTTQSAGVVITMVCPYTAASGGVVSVRNVDERDASTWGLGQTIYRMDAGTYEMRRPTGWALSSSVQHTEFQFDRSTIGDGTINLFTTAVDPATTNEAIASVPGSTGQTITVRDTAVYAISWFLALGATATAQGNLDINVGAALIARGYIIAGQNAHTLNQDNIYLPAGSVLTFTLSKSTGGTSNVTSRIRLTKLGSF